MRIKYGPYPRKDTRMQVEVEYSDGTVKSMLYSRHLMEVKLARRLTDDETVDHHDGDKLNDDISNLKLMCRASNAEKDAVKASNVFVKCLLCSTLFKLSKDQQKRSMKNCAGPFCSRVCSGKYGKSIQMGTIQKLSRTDFTLTYYKDSGAPLSEAQKKHLLKYTK